MQQQTRYSIDYPMMHPHLMQFWPYCAPPMECTQTLVPPTLPEIPPPCLQGEDECLELLEKLTKAKLLKARDITKAVGLPIKVIREKLLDRTLDVIHLRKTKDYLQGIVKIGNDLAKVMQDKIVSNPTVSVSNPRKKRKMELIDCPLLAMGYAGIECPEKIQKDEVVQHIACHVATLYKRLLDLERTMDPTHEIPVDV